MLDFGFYNMDCMEGMKEFPDKYFDLAIVDPVYGDVTQGGYWKSDKYINTLWEQEKTGRDYFLELFRVCKNVIIWGGGTTLSRKLPAIHNVGSYGTNNTLTEYRSQT